MRYFSYFHKSIYLSLFHRFDNDFGCVETAHDSCVASRESSSLGIQDIHSLDILAATITYPCPQMLARQKGLTQSF